MDSRTTTRRGALALMVSGAVGIVMGTSSTTDVANGRSTTIETTSDPLAYVSLDEYETNSNPAELTNRTGNDVDVDLYANGAEFDVGDDGSSDGTTPTVSLAPGELEVFEVLAADTRTVSFDATLLASGQAVGSITFSRDVEPKPQADNIQLTGNVRPVGNSGKYRFEIALDGDYTEAVLDGIEIRSTSVSSAVRVAAGSILTADRYGTLVNSPIDVGGPSVNFTQDVTITTSQSGRFEFDHFTDGNGNKVGMNGETVEITVSLTDGSTADLTLS